MIRSTNSFKSPVARKDILLRVSLSVLKPPSATSDTPTGTCENPAILF